MFSTKTKKYKLSTSKQNFLQLLEQNNFIKKTFHFGEVLFIKEQENIIAIKNKCPHQSKSMEGCTIKNNQVICPWHKFSFNLDTGRGHGLYLERYDLTELEDGFYLTRPYFSWFGE